MDKKSNLSYTVFNKIVSSISGLSSTSRIIHDSRYGHCSVIFIHDDSLYQLKSMLNARSRRPKYGMWKQIKKLLLDHIKVHSLLNSSDFWGLHSYQLFDHLFVLQMIISSQLQCEPQTNCAMCSFIRSLQLVWDDEHTLVYLLMKKWRTLKAWVTFQDELKSS